MRIMIRISMGNRKIIMKGHTIIIVVRVMMNLIVRIIIGNMMRKMIKNIISTLIIMTNVYKC